MKRLDIKSGQKWNRLEAVRELPKNKHGHRVYQFRCVCGTFKDVQPSLVVAGAVKSCGCLQSETGPRNGFKRKLLPEEVVKNAVFSVYRKRAERKKITFSLSKSDFVELISKDCHYCKSPPGNFSFSGFSRYRGTFISNGIDRIYSSEGYTANNTVTCCKTCNFAKSTMTQEEFKIWIRRIFENWASK